ncbi:MAG: multidrug ABC transporter permease [Burkholderiaceae bacterium]
MRPLLWFVVFSAGFTNVFVAIVPPYETYIEYKEYMVPGLLGMVALFNGMQSSLSMVYDRDGGDASAVDGTLARGWLLGFAVGRHLPLEAVMAVFGDCAPLWRGDAASPGAWLVGRMPWPVARRSCWRRWADALGVCAPVGELCRHHELCDLPCSSSARRSTRFGSWKKPRLNPPRPNSHLAGQRRCALPWWGSLLLAWAVVLGCSLVFFVLALWGYDPQRGWIRRKGAA